MSTENKPKRGTVTIHKVDPQPCELDLGECRTNLLPLLYEMNQIATETGDLSTILNILLQLMQRHLKVVRGMVSLYEPEDGRIFIHESFGLTEEEAARGFYYLGEGITGKVVETGQAIVVPRISEEPAFLNRTRSRDVTQDKRLSFICVPILRGKKVMGTISAERIYDNRGLLELDVEVLSILATTTAQAVELYLLENVRKVELENENRLLRLALKARFKPTNIIGNAKPMQDVYQLIEKVTRSKATVLILGESGVGKELVASAIHYNSPSSNGPFVKFNCAALPESIIESELFGHERGAFTGAANQRRGRFEEADGGSIFLDEVGELSLAMQAKLLRVLQEKSFERVGGNATIKVSLRILAATNRNLQEMVEKGSFREDLYYRLNVFPITIPPLRDRGSDIVTLADYFVSHFSAEMGLTACRISTPALNMLTAYHWPGNVRELENVIERAMLLSEDGVIHGHNLPPSMQPPASAGDAATGGLDARLETIEYEMIVGAMKQHRGNITAAAEQLGLTRRILGLRMAKYKMDNKTFRQSA
ncbi:MAG: sigma 54-interacting transcriptional regulator [Parasulfuritortus sp.]|nr:sigma 54-interacting transcriptional regulator [Parasulfuritortus sp.]